MTREDHKRIEFILHKENDRAMIDYLSQIQHSGILSDFLRGLIDRSMHGDVNAQSDVRLIAEIQDLRAMMLSFDDRLTAYGERLEKIERHDDEIKHLWREMGRMNERLEQMRVNGMVEDDALTTPLADPNAAKQAELSAKMKAMHDQFGKLQ